MNDACQEVAPKEVGPEGVGPAGGQGRTFDRKSVEMLSFWGVWRDDRGKNGRAYREDDQ
jgi:hypothetical protein